MATRKSTLSRKLAVTVVIPVLAGIGLVSSADSWRDAEQYIATKQREAEMIATVFGSTIADDLANDDRPTALRSLRATAHIPEVRAVSILDSHNRPWVSLGDGVFIENSASSPRLSRIIALMRGQPVEVRTPIVKAGSAIGSISMVVETASVRDNLIAALWRSLMIAAGVSAVALAFSLRIQRGILKPVKKLTDLMTAVRTEQRFDLSAERETNDETGQLVDAFNDMLVNIRTRDDKLAEHRKTLELKIEERTRDLRVAKEAAEAATRAKSEFLATMSHEIRTPMNGMMVMSEILAGAELPQRYRHYAELVVKSGTNLLAIINDILDYSKIEAGGMTIEDGHVSPSQVADDIVQLFWQQARSKHLDLSARVAPEVPRMVRGDPVRLSQVLGNLVNNALKFTEKGHVAVSVGYDSPKDGGTAGRLIISVSDTGIGISPEGLDKIFDSFVQADQSTTRKYGGTGLGLTICRKLAEAMGGGIRAQSRPGEGTVFHIDIPVEPIESAHACTRAETGSKALVVADAGPARDVLSSALANRGIVVLELDPENAPNAPSGADFVFARASVLENLPSPAPGARAVLLSEIGDFSGDHLFRSAQAHDTLMYPLTTSSCDAVIDRLIVGAPEGAGTMTPDTASSRIARRYPGLKVLVADDSAVNREVIALALKQLEIEPDIVENGVQAIAKARAAAYDIVLMDASMPDMDGFAATRIIRKFERSAKRQRMPVIALTAHTMSQIAGKLEEAGMDGHLAKPFTLLSLSGTIDKWCAGESAANGPQSAGAANAKGADTLQPLPVIDTIALNNLREIAGADAANMVLRLYRIFRDHVPAALKTLETACLEDDRPAITAAAHALKSMSLNMAATRLAGSLAALETAAMEGPGIDWMSAVSTIRSEFEQALITLDDMLEDQPKPAQRAAV